jgi:DNA-binding protein HU-beta
MTKGQENEQKRNDRWYGNEKSGLPRKDCEAALSAALEVVEDALKAGDKVQLVGFGTFEVKERAARSGRNPKTKEPVQIPASKSPTFKPGKALKDAIQ